MEEDEEYKFYSRVVTAVLEGKHPFSIVYQLHAQNIDGSNYPLKSAESLTRFPDFESRPIAPYTFFKTLTKMSEEISGGGAVVGLEEKFIYLQLEKLAVELEDSIDSLGTEYVVSFNISPKFFTDRFKEQYLTILARHPKLSQKNIAIELTEISPFPIGKGQARERQAFIKRMQELQRGGTIFALDDFNTDFANSEALKSFPWDVVKIDHTKFRILIEEILHPDFNMHFASLSNSQDGNVLDILLSNLESMQLKGLKLPKKIICEGLSEGTCPNNHKENIPMLIAKYYGDRLKTLGYKKRTFLYQGYEINKPFSMSDMLELINPHNVSV